MWKWFIYYRCHNVNRGSTKEGETKKKRKLITGEVHPLPPINGDDEVSYKRNLDLLKTEMKQQRPRGDALKELIGIVGNSLLCCVQVFQDFALINRICKNQTSQDNLEENFPLWARAIVKSSRETQVGSSALQALMSLTMVSRYYVLTK